MDHSVVEPTFLPAAQPPGDAAGQERVVVTHNDRCDEELVFVNKAGLYRLRGKRGTAYTQIAVR